MDAWGKDGTHSNESSFALLAKGRHWKMRRLTKRCRTKMTRVVTTRRGEGVNEMFAKKRLACDCAGTWLVMELKCQENYNSRSTVENSLLEKTIVEPFEKPFTKC